MLSLKNIHSRRKCVYYEVRKGSNTKYLSALFNWRDSCLTLLFWNVWPDALLSILWLSHRHCHAADQYQPLDSTQSDRRNVTFYVCFNIDAIHSNPAAVSGVRVSLRVPSYPVLILRCLDVRLGDASQNTWSWSVRRAEKKASDWTTYCWVIIFDRILNSYS